MEWTTVTVIIALVGLGVTVVKPVVSLTKSITRLTVVVENLQEDMVGLNTKNSKAHEKLWDHNERQDGKLEDHEKRIGSLEHKE